MPIFLPGLHLINFFGLCRNNILRHRFYFLMFCICQGKLRHVNGTLMVGDHLANKPLIKFITF